MKTITLDKGESVSGKEEAWIAIGNKYEANELRVLEKGDYYLYESSDFRVKAKIGYQLTWKIKEDDIHVFGSKETAIQVDSTIEYKESVEKLQLAIVCWKEIEANKKKYY